MPTLTKLDIKKIVQLKFPENQYMREEQVKKQIVIHHTVSGPDAVTVFEGWSSNPDRVATSFAISGNGTIVQGFGSKYWAHHLGLKRPNNTALNKASIGIEVCNWGGLTFKDGKYYSAFMREVPAANVIDYGKKFRGFRFFHKYTPAQIESLRQLLVFLADKYGIAKTYNADMWDISSNALSGKNGIYTHVSYRQDKSDMHPQEELVEMLKGLIN